MQLQDEYEVIRELGRGGFGVVYLVRHRKTGAKWAAKVLLDEKDQHALRLLWREVKQLLKYRNLRYVVRIVGEYLSATPPFFLMPYADGGNVLRHLGRLTDRQVLTVMRQLLETLVQIHGNGGFHRDIKPENILVFADGTTALADFGLGSSPEVTANFTVSPGGTFGYAAPEVRDGGNYSLAGDVYSAGATWFHLLTKRHPKNFSAPLDARAVCGDASAQIATLIREMTASDPRARPSAAEALRRVEVLLDGADECLPVEVPTVKINWGAVAGIGGIVLVVAAVTVFLVVRPKRKRATG